VAPVSARLGKVLLFAVLLATLWPADLLAQSRARRTSSGRVVVAGSRYYYPSYYYHRGFYPGYYGSFYYGPFYSPFYYGPFDSPFYWGPFGQYPYPYPYYGWGYDDTGSARLQVTPRNAKVYIDGYFVGVVDDFDGNLQRLNVEAGEHELQLHLEGYRPYALKVLFVRGRTVRIAHAMQPLGPGEPPAPMPKPDETLRAQPYRDPSTSRQSPPRGGQPSEFGSLLLRVRPADAQILVDGEVWTAPGGDDQFVIELTEGPHRIEARKEGFQSYVVTVRVRRGETVRLNVSLTPGGLSGEF
jgi:PEGA domain